jgi:hypothetical protein
MALQKKSQAVIDLYGCGLKCFRNVESTRNCLSIKQDPSRLLFTYPWIDGINCITLPNLPDTNLLDHKKAFEIVYDYRYKKHDLLYDIYVKSMEMNQLYSPKNYVPNHIMKHINENL